MSKADDIVSEIKTTESALKHDLQKSIEQHLNQLIEKTGLDVAGIDVQLVDLRSADKAKKQVLLSSINVLCDLPEQQL